MKPLRRMMLSLKGLSVGDAFGETLSSGHPNVRPRLEKRLLAEQPWLYTDDTEMALSIVDSLRRHGRIDPDSLAQGFVDRYTHFRNYGLGARQLLKRLRQGGDWRQEAPALFGGMGSYGNGAAMRVAPVGACFAEDLESARENAVASSLVTHSHPEGIAGAIAVAIAAALAWRIGEGEQMAPSEFLRGVAEMIPEGQTRDGIETAAGRAFESPPEELASLLGSGQDVSAQDTVPFALWCVARHLDNYEEALWATARGRGDVDTTCAIVGGVVVLSSRENGIPQAWLKACEPLPPGFD